MKRVYLETLTCDRRGLDANRIKEFFLRNNYVIVKKPQDADVIVFFGCAALNSITEQALRKIEKLKSYHTDLIVAGCLPEIEKERLAKIFHGRLLRTKDFNSIDRLFPDANTPLSAIEDANIVFRNVPERTVQGILRKSIQTLPLLNTAFFWGRRRVLWFIFGNSAMLYKYLQDESTYHVRISTGCLGQCSYCVIRQGVGPSISKTLEVCLGEFKKGLQQGYRSFVLDGDDIGAYGLDIQTNFPEVLDRITQIQESYRLVLSNFNPVWLVKYIDELERLFKRGRIDNLHCPIQSGSSVILARMNRYADTEQMRDAFLRLKQSNPNMAITTDYIIGFPTETEEDVQTTLQYITDIGFNGGMVISFSLMEGTEAARLSPQVSQDVLNRRVKQARRYLRQAGYHTFATPGFRSFIFFRS